MAESGFYPGSTLSDVGRQIMAEKAHALNQQIAQNQFLASLNREVTASQGQRSNERISRERNATAVQQAQIQAATAAGAQEVQMDLGTAEFANRLKLAQAANAQEMMRIRAAEQQGFFADHRELLKIANDKRELDNLDAQATATRAQQATQFTDSLKQQNELTRYAIDNPQMNSRVLEELAAQLPEAQARDANAQAMADYQNALLADNNDSFWAWDKTPEAWMARTEFPPEARALVQLQNGRFVPRASHAAAVQEILRNGGRRQAAQAPAAPVAVPTPIPIGTNAPVVLPATNAPAYRPGLTNAAVVVSGTNANWYLPPGQSGTPGPVEWTTESGRSWRQLGNSYGEVPVSPQSSLRVGQALPAGITATAPVAVPAPGDPVFDPESPYMMDSRGLVDPRGQTWDSAIRDINTTPARYTPPMAIINLINNLRARQQAAPAVRTDIQGPSLEGLRAYQQRQGR